MLKPSRSHGFLHICNAAHKAETRTSPGLAELGVLPVQAPSGQDPHCAASVLDSLKWWLDPRVLCKGVPFTRPQPSAHPVSDTSVLGWGAHLGHLRTQGLWSQEELLLHINIRELRAVCLACQAFLPHITNKTVSVLTDNTSAMYYINRQDGAC